MTEWMAKIYFSFILNQVEILRFSFFSIPYFLIDFHNILLQPLEKVSSVLASFNRLSEHILKCSHSSIRLWVFTPECHHTQP